MSKIKPTISVFNPGDHEFEGHKFGLLCREHDALHQLEWMPLVHLHGQGSCFPNLGGVIDGRSSDPLVRVRYSLQLVIDWTNSTLKRFTQLFFWDFPVDDIRNFFIIYEKF